MNSASELPFTARSQLGSVIAGTYLLRKRLGAGAMGEVYEAEHVRLGKPFAVKFLRGGAIGDARAVRRFKREARVVAGLESPHIVAVFDCGELADGTPYLVMERLVGEDLRKVIDREGRLEVERAVRIALGACQGLVAVHESGLVHRDLKPANLFLSRGPEEEHCKILDFGVAKSITSDATSQGAVIGTVRYMAPEQLRDSASVGPQTDIYAVGAILYECLTGTSPYDAPNVEELMFQILHGSRRAVSSLRPDVPLSLELALERALARQPEQRFDSAQEFASALQTFTSPFPLQPTVTPAPNGSGKHLRRPDWRWLGGAAAGALLGSLVMAYATSPSPPTQTVCAQNPIQTSPSQTSPIQTTPIQSPTNVSVEAGSDAALTLTVSSLDPESAPLTRVGTGESAGEPVLENASPRRAVASRVADGAPPPARTPRGPRKDAATSSNRTVPLGDALLAPENPYVD